MEKSLDGNIDNDRLNQICRHWWLSLDDHGLVDLSLKGENENPLVYCNRIHGGRWNLAFGKAQREIKAFLKERPNGCFYLTEKKRRVTQADVAESLPKEFPGAKKSGELAGKRLVALKRPLYVKF